MALYALLHAASLILLFSANSSHAASTNNGEEARWLVQASKWATLSWIEGKDLDSNESEGDSNNGGDLKSLVVSMAESEGRIFFYLTENITFKASITLSEAQLDPALFFGAKCGPDGKLDPQDPRCAKLTISGVVAPCPQDSKQLALDTLFAAHPQMKDWPEDHDFIPCEMKIHEENGLWMIANFGGGGYMNAAAYYDSDPMQHAVKDFDSSDDRALEDSSACYNPSSHECECLPEKCGDNLCSKSGGMWTSECDSACECEPALSSVDSYSDGGGQAGHSGHGEHGGGEHDGHNGHGGHGNGGGSSSSFTKEIELPLLPRPDFRGDHAGHARWIIAKSLWTTISTISSIKEGEPFGNIRSVVDGNCLMGSSGLPYFYLPKPDPTTIDIQSDARIALSFTEAALAERVGDDGIPCGGKDAEDPTCGKLTLIGHARLLEDDDQIKLAQKAFKIQHPRASWLSSGGAHTGGSYYTLHLLEIMFLMDYGGFTKVTPEDYLAWTPDHSKLIGEPQCDMGDMSQYTTYASATSTTSISTSALMLILFVSFFGSVLGGLLKDKIKTMWHGKHTGYSQARGADNVEIC